MEADAQEKGPKPGEGKDKGFTIIVNGRQKIVTEKKQTFEQIVALAFDTPPTGNNLEFTVTYRKGEDQKPGGTLVAGEFVNVKDGMIFNVTATDKS